MSDTTPPSEDPVVTTVRETPETRPKPDKPPKKPLVRRLLAVGVWDVVRLVVISIVVGLFLIAQNFGPDSQGLNIGGPIWELIQTLFSAFLWVLGHFWKPLLAGAAIVLPVWILWRLASLPFRKQP